MRYNDLDGTPYYQPEKGDIIETSHCTIYVISTVSLGHTVRVIWSTDAKPEERQRSTLEEFQEELLLAMGDDEVFEMTPGNILLKARPTFPVIEVE